ncbi:tryptophan synthase subunit beta [Helicobacter sp. 13S00482-2]|uniref:tryptophan synthase subunit beta n=1 Tax=Helicobacter sp. 13S00482-2 TaxID=1476200 RepID=UPI000BA6453A|nr:tryptophan synthase subunit beta [Helicobacter sp. 13S00482-2]PAF54197.1 tryptophan synthase subunit beta [Helicobacter sp. 13S00482-2]
MEKIPLKSHHKFFGQAKNFGGQYIPEILRPALLDLENAYKKIFPSKTYQRELKDLLKHFVGRPTPLIYAKNASKILGNEIFLKFEGLANTGAHKINNAVGQVLLAKKMGKKKVIAETGAGQHGLATAAAAAKLGLSCEVYMGEIDIARQRPNVFNMELFGARVISVTSGTKTLKDAVNETLRVWSKESSETFYVLGSALGPYPYPDIVRDLQSIIGKEVKKQCKDYFETLPDIMIACVGGGSNSIGFFSEFVNDKSVRLVGVEAGGIGNQVGENATRMSKNSKKGIAQGYKSIFLQDNQGNLSPTHSISAGLDYAGIGPQLAYLGTIGRIEFTSALDSKVIEALKFFAKHEGIIPALESSHALAEVINISQKVKNKKIIANISGRGDKDIFITAKTINPKDWVKFLKEEIARMQELRIDSK